MGEGFPGREVDAMTQEGERGITEWNWLNGMGNGRAGQKSDRRDN